MPDSSLDFTPFDAEENLAAVVDVLRAVRHMSWSYAGDISRVVKKICQTFDAGRCILFAAREGSRFDVYEYVEGEGRKTADFFNGKAGQLWLKNLAESGSDFLSSERFVEMAEVGESISFGSEYGENSPYLLDPPSHILPLKNPYTSRYGIKPGFMLIQEPRSLTRWNRKQLDSLVIVAEYLAMTIECERLTSAMQIETGLGERVPGLLSRRRFSELAQWEISKLSESTEDEDSHSSGASLLLIGFPERTKLSLPQLIRDSEVILDLCGRAVVKSLTARELAAYWRGDILVALSRSEPEEFKSRVGTAVRQAFEKWLVANGIDSDGHGPEGIPAMGMAEFPRDGKSLEELYQAALLASKIQ